MMILEREAHEALLNELLDGELPTSRRTEILQDLRVDHTTATQGIADMTDKTSKLQANHDDLIVSNSKLFRQLGVVGGEEDKEEETQKEYSETVTISQLEQGGQ